jgi:hypothetical protein
MPFSRSQNSKTAKKSAFIARTRHLPRLHPANKKAGDKLSSDFRAGQTSLPFL